MDSPRSLEISLYRHKKTQNWTWIEECLRLICHFLHVATTLRHQHQQHTLKHSHPKQTLSTFLTHNSSVSTLWMSELDSNEGYVHLSAELILDHNCSQLGKQQLMQSELVQRVRRAAWHKTALLTCKLRKGTTYVTNTFQYQHLLWRYKSTMCYFLCECCNFIISYSFALYLFSTKDPIESCEYIV